MVQRAATDETPTWGILLALFLLALAGAAAVVRQAVVRRHIDIAAPRRRCSRPPVAAAVGSAQRVRVGATPCVGAAGGAPLRSSYPQARRSGRLAGHSRPDPGLVQQPALERLVPRRQRHGGSVSTLGWPR